MLFRVNDNIKEKQKIVSLLRKKILTSFSIVFFNYFKINANIFCIIRATGRQKHIKLLVVRNSLLKLALKGTDFDEVIKKIFGPIFIILSPNDINDIIAIFNNHVVNGLITPCSLIVNKIVYIKEKFFEVSMFKYPILKVLTTLRYLLNNIIFIMKNILKKKEVNI